MKPLKLRNMEIRDYVDADYNIILNLKLKEGDVKELHNMLGIEPKEYMKWHLENHKNTTKVMLIDDKIVGIVGVTDYSVIYFTTVELSKGSAMLPFRFSNEIMKSIMDEAGIDSLLTYVDATYESAIKWNKLRGFIMLGEVTINGNLFYCMQYTLP